MIKLVCPDCQRENLPERIYCHDCGAKLDRSKLSADAIKTEQPKDAHKRLKTMFNPQGVKLRQNFFAVSKVVIGALATAAVIQMLLPPDLPPRPKMLVLASIGMELETASSRPGGQPLRYSEDQVNAYLASTFKGKQAALSTLLNFERATVGLDENLCRVTVERSVFGLWSVYTGAQYSVALQDGALAAQAHAGSIGRLPIHPQLLKWTDPFFASLWAALERDRKSLVKMGGIELHPQSITILPKQG